MDNENTLPDWLAQLEKRRQQRSTNRNPAAADVSFPAEPPLQPAERRDIYRRYLAQWQQQHNLSAGADKEYGVIFEEEWARHCENLLTHGNIAAEHTVLLHMPAALQAAADSAPAAEEPAAPDGRALWARVAEPKIPAGRPVLVVGEKDFADALCQKIAPHAADAVSGAVTTAIRRTLHQAENTLRENLMQEIAPMIEEIVQIHVARAIGQLKKQENAQ